MERKYQICIRCIMDTTDPNIEFDENGICNNCREFEQKAKKRLFRGEEGKTRLNEIIKKIKEEGKNKQHDCVVGVSGGIDSSYTLYLAKKFGLRPLAVHLDNGWNSKTATRNLSKILKKLNIDLYTYVIDWEEFKDMQLAYLKASVLDTEALTDHAIKATLYKTANERRIKYIITGINFITEGIIPKAWGHYKNDYANILDIHKKFGKKQLKTFPVLTLRDRIYYQIIKKIRMLEILNYVPYNKEEVKKFIFKEFGWEDYGGKHRESTFTHFFQSYILPRKFNIDKRRAHLSTLICAGQITREQALEEIKKSIYTEEELRREKEYMIRKFSITEKEFDDIIALPIKSHYDFKSNEKFLRRLRSIYKPFLRR